MIGIVNPKYFWAVSVQARFENTAQCLLVIIGDTPEGKKDLTGWIVPESAQSWKDPLLDPEGRRFAFGPELAVDNGALGFCQAIGPVWPKTAGHLSLCAKSNKTALAMIFKLAEAPEMGSGRLGGRNQLPKSSSV